MRDGGHIEADIPLGAGFDRTGENFAVGEVLGAVRIDPGAAGDIDLQIGTGTGEMDLLLSR